MGQVWAVDSLGGYAHADNLSKLFRDAVQPICKFRQFADVKDATQQGMHKGATFHWDVINNVATQGTNLTETTTMAETNFTITQGTLTVDEAGNSIPFSHKLDALSDKPLRPIVTKALRNDATKYFDIMAEAQFDSTPLRVYGSATDGVVLTTNGTVTGTCSVAFNKDHAKRVMTVMKERNIPAYEKDDYFAITWPSTIETFRDDFEDIAQYTPEGFGTIRNGEIGRYQKCRYIEQTNIDKASTTYTDWIYFIGEDTVAEAINTPEEIRAKIPSDYGRSKGVAWYYIGGFGLVHTAAAQARIVKWESAA